ncbi:hypothetical protein L0222_02235 [bacterium]|nr:hypothetical protein [bacterium]
MGALRKQLADLEAQFEDLKMSTGLYRIHLSQEFRFTGATATFSLEYFSFLPFCAHGMLYDITTLLCTANG